MQCSSNKIDDTVPVSLLVPSLTYVRLGAPQFAFLYQMLRKFSLDIDAHADADE